jgi:hypothetical protein
MNISYFAKVQPPNTITLGRSETDGIIQKITIFRFIPTLYLLPNNVIHTYFLLIKSYLGLGHYDHINQMITNIKLLPLY